MVEMNKLADMKIMQMTFMILFVFIFFTFAGLFFLSIQSGKIAENFNNLQRESAISSVETISNMPELNCDSSRTMCLDEDKVITFATISKSYKNFWPVASIRVRKVFPMNVKNIRCPAANCSYYEVYNSNQTNVVEYGTFVSICKAVRNEGVVQEICELGRLDVGVKISS
ncbi:MAG: hypothetical protein WCI72_00785 [archaeon]